MSELKLFVDGDEEWAPLGEAWPEIELLITVAPRAALTRWHRSYDLAQAKERKRRRALEKELELAEGEIGSLTEDGEEELRDLHRELLELTVRGLRGKIVFGKIGAAPASTPRALVEQLMSAGLTNVALERALKFQRPTDAQRRLLPVPRSDGEGGA